MLTAEVGPEIASAVMTPMFAGGEAARGYAYWRNKP
jgi:hypothetical protein